MTGKSLALLLLCSMFASMLNAQVKLDFDSGIPVNLTASAGSSMMLSETHKKAGAKSLRWTAINRASLTLKGININAQDYYYKGESLLFFIYNATFNSADTLIIRFYDANNVLRREGSMLLNYKGWREYHRSYRIDYGVNNTNGSNIQNDRNGDRSFVIDKMHIEFRSSSASAKEIYFDELHLIGNAEKRFAGLHNLVDYKQYQVDGYNMSLKNYLYVNDKAEILQNTDLSTRLPSDLNIVNERIELTFKSEIASLKKDALFQKLTSASVTSYLNLLMANGVTATGTVDTLRKFAIVCHFLAESAVNNNDGDAKILLGRFAKYLLDQGIAEGGRIVINYNQIGSSNIIALGFLSALEHLDSSLQEQWLKMLKWSLEYNKIYAKQDLEPEGDYLGKTFLLTKLALLGQNEEAKIVDLFFIGRFLDKYVTPTDGTLGFVKPDYVAFHHSAHHSRYMYNFNYWISRAAELRGTSFQISADTYKKARSIMKTLLIETSKGVIQANAATGRAPFSSTFITKIDDVNRLIGVGRDALGTSSEPELESFRDYIFHQSNPKFDGFYQLNYAQTGIFRKNNWTASIRGFTNWLWGAEIYAADNRYGRYQSYGALEILYGDNLAASGYIAEGLGWDWNMVPGATTVRKANYSDLNAVAGDFGTEFQSKSFVGALTLGKSGIFAMDFEQNPWMYEGIQSTGSPRYQTDNLRFRKSVFAFHDFLVCLGTGIQSSNTIEPVITTLFQSIDRSNLPGIYINSPNMNSNAFDEMDLPSSNAYNWLINKHGSGYYVPGAIKTLKLFSNDQTTPYNRGADIENRSAVYSSKSVKAWIDHGKNTSSTPGRYEFAILPGTTPVQMTAFADRVENGLIYNILEQTDSAHVVKYIPDNLISYVFFTSFNASSRPNVNLGKFRSIDRPALLGIREIADSLIVSISDPDLHYVASNTRAKFKAASSLVTLKLNGEWSVVDKYKGIASESYAGSATMLSFNLKDGLSQMIKLVKVHKLPVNIYHFDVKSEPEGQLLKWSSLFESNTDHFRVFRSIDGINFEKIGTMPAAGNSAVRRDYFLLDNSFPRGVSGLYYRLMLNDKDNEISYQKDVYVRVSKHLYTNKIKIYPNPVSTEAMLNYSIDHDDIVTVQLIDILGKIVYMKKILLVSSNNIAKVDLTGINPGSYLIRFKGRLVTQEQVIIKL